MKFLRSLAWLGGGHAQSSWQISLGLLLLRVGAGGMMLGGHGLAKLTGFAQMRAQFPDPLGIGSAASLALAVFAEAFCSAAVILGFVTRLAVVPLLTTMLVAIFLVHGSDPWEKKELAALYLVPFLAILLAGPGRVSIDASVARSGPKP